MEGGLKSFWIDRWERRLNMEGGSKTFQVEMGIDNKVFKSPLG